VTDRLCVRDLMTPGVFAVSLNDSLETIRTLMAERSIRHAPVVNDEGMLMGLVTQRDLIRSSLRDQALPSAGMAAAMQLTTAAEIMTQGVVTAAPDQDIRDAARIMLAHKYGCLPVVEDSRLVGIVTESDFVRLLAAGD